MALALYGRTTFGAGGALLGVLGWQDLSFDTRRNVAGLVARGETDGRLFTAALQAEYMFTSGALRWGPTGSLEHYALSVDGFSEKGAGAWNLAVADQDQDITLASLGLRGDYTLSPATRLHGGLAWTRAKGDDGVLPVGFIGLPAAAIPVDGIDEDWVDLSLGFTTRIAGHGRGETVLGGEYRGSFGGSHENHGLNLFVKMTF